MASILILGALLPLAAALVAQFGFGLHPCHFCLLQRYPYLVALLMGGLSLVLPRGTLLWRGAVAFGLYAFLGTALLGMVHSGIEQGWLHYTGGCVAETTAGDSLAALRAAIASAPVVPCNEIAATILGLSMAVWNVIWALLMLGLGIAQARFDGRRYDAQQH